MLIYIEYRNSYSKHYFIAKTLLERTGATVTFGNRSRGKGGASVSVRWPNPVFKAT